MNESGAPAQWDTGDIGEIRTEALDTLSDAFVWKLGEERWQEIHRVLATMAAALGSGDVDALAAATAHLELARCGSFR